MEEYTGYMEAELSDEALASIYEHQEQNPVGLLENQYLIVKRSDGDVVDTFKWNGDSLVRVTSKTVNNRYIGKIRPRNVQQ